MNTPIITKPTVRLWRNRHSRPYAYCDCGWTGKPRWFTASAVQDALKHAADETHRPAAPLDTWKAARR